MHLHPRLVCAALSGLICVQASAVDCQAELKNRLQNDLGLSYKAFDQTVGKGMRVLAHMGCSKEAADLILVYMQMNKDFTPSMTWHVAQQRAMQGEHVIAAQYGRMSLKETENFAVQPLRWNDYVLATIAFLERDLAKLKTHRNKVAEAKATFWGNEMNLKILDKLVNNFGKGYKEATAAPEIPHDIQPRLPAP
ncbi:MAG: hypothetical protein WKG03_03930 [Telluria sp.]